MNQKNYLPFNTGSFGRLWKLLHPSCTSHFYQRHSIERHGRNYAVLGLHARLSRWGKSESLESVIKCFRGDPTTPIICLLCDITKHEFVENVDDKLCFSSLCPLPGPLTGWALERLSNIFDVRLYRRRRGCQSKSVQVCTRGRGV